jgi:hypothetical protein
LIPNGPTSSPRLSSPHLRKDLSWAFTPAIVEWKHGDFADEFVEISHEQAEKIVQYFRERWGPHGQ